MSIGLTKIVKSRETSLGFVIIVVGVVLALLRPEAFLSWANAEAVANGMVYDLLLATGMTLVLILWGIDLSVGSVLALSSVITALLLRAGVPISLSILLGLTSSAACGFINGYMVARYKIAPFIVTLSMMAIARGMATVLTSGYYLSGLPEAFRAIGRSRVLGFPIPLLLVILILAALGVLLSRWRYLHQMYFVGSNPEAAKLSGLQTQKIIIAGYVISSTLAGIAAVFMTSRLSMGFAGFGLQAELRAIAAAVLGGRALLVVPVRFWERF